MPKSLRVLWAILDPATRRASAGLLVLMLLGALTEAIGLGLFLPVLQIMADENQIAANPWLSAAYRFTGSTSPEEFLLYALALLVFAYVIRSGLQLLVSYSTQTTVFAAGTRLSKRMFDLYVRAPFTFHLATNSATLVRNTVDLPTEICSAGLRPGLILISDLLMVVVVMGMMLFLQPFATIVAAIVLGGTAGLYYVSLRKHLRRWGSSNVALSRDRILWTNQAMGAVKEIKVAGAEEFVNRHFAQVNDRWGRIKVLSLFVTETPRPMLETVGILLLLAGAAGLIASGYRVAELLSIIGLFTVAAVRLLPTVGRITFNLGKLHINIVGLETLSKDLESLRVDPAKKNGTGAPLPFTRDIRLEGVNFYYPEAAKPALADIALTIRNGESVALVGASGAGKTTLLGILIGLLEPTSGTIRVDGQPISCQARAWQSKLGYIPQDVYLLDDTLRRNVAFAVPDPEIDDAKVWKVLAMAQMDEVVRAMPDGLETRLGERGIRVSGGQRQRIAIARALYHDPEILVLDEATSALDAATEFEINQSVNRLAGTKTIIVIAHRVSTVRELNTLHFFSHGRLVASGSFDALERDCPEFRHVVLGSQEEREEA